LRSRKAGCLAGSTLFNNEHICVEIVLDNAEGAARHASHERFLIVCKRSGISSPPPSQKNLFGDSDGSEEEEDLKAE
jgi:hypothetical protein